MCGDVGLEVDQVSGSLIICRVAFFEGLGLIPIVSPTPWEGTTFGANRTRLEKLLDSDRQDK